jgi:hypothetical protein
MGYIPTRIVGPYNLIDDYQAVYVAQNKTIMKQVLLSNVTGTAANVRLAITGFQGSPSSINAIMQDVEIEANSTLVADIVQVLEVSDKLFARCSISGAINLTVSGVVQEDTE